MKLAKSLLLGSAAGLCAVSGVQAADLPMRKAAPVEYVRVCTAFGAGFFFIPGTDTCLRVGGRARFEYQYTSQRSARDVSGFRAIGRLNLDARTQTAYGALRTFVRFDIMSRSGAYLSSGTAQRYAFAFPGLGQDTFGRTQKHVDIDKAFIQFAGITAGRAASFFDFYAADFEFIGANIVSNAPSTNLLAYTATFGGGFSATISAEDPIFRRNPVYASNGFTAFGATNAPTGFLPLGAGAVTLGNNTAFSPVAVPNGTASNFAFIDVAQRSRMPDFVGALRYDASWGSAQVMGAVHEIALGAASTAGAGLGVFSSVGGPVGAPAARNIENFAYGFAVGGGLKFNLPQIAPGDQLFLQVAYAQGAGHYTGLFSPQGQELVASNYTGRSNFGGIDSALRLDGKQELTETYSANIAFLHYWTPEIRQAIFGSHGRVHFDRTLRGVASPAIGAFATGAGGIAAGAFFNPLFKDYTNTYVGSNLAYSPVRDLDFGVEVVYERLEFLGGASNGRVADLNKFPTQATTQAGAIRTIKVDDNILVRLRVQRDF